ncbi:MAG: hypothetical protein LBC84_00815 [Prevotellaceae bacterium]|jgi:organic radical activating enzyme|nr:hypothetical protein [Prevotellaceae bacterium]
MLLIPAILTTFRSLKDKTIKLEFETNELSPEQMTALAQNLQAFGYLAFKKDAFRTEQLATIDELKADYEDKQKTPSKRLRDVLFVAYKQKNEGYSEFEAYYQHKMGKFIDHVKSHLEP